MIDRYLGRPLRPLIKVGLSLIKNAFQSLAKSVLIPWGPAAAALGAYKGIHKNIRVGDQDVNDTEWRTGRYHKNS